MKITKRGHLADHEKEMVRTLYTDFGKSGVEIANMMEVGNSSIYRCLKGLERGEPKELTPEIKAQVYQAQATKPPENDHEKTPLQFSQAQLAELRQDINLSRMRGSVNVLPQLHRLYREVYKEIQALKSEEQAISEEMEADDLLNYIVQTIVSLPPIVRHQIQTTLDDLDKGKIVRL